MKTKKNDIKTTFQRLVNGFSERDLFANVYCLLLFILKYTLYEFLIKLKSIFINRYLSVLSTFPYKNICCTYTHTHSHIIKMQHYKNGVESLCLFFSLTSTGNFSSFYNKA